MGFLKKFKVDFQFVFHKYQENVSTKYDLDHLV